MTHTEHQSIPIITSRDHADSCERRLRVLLVQLVGANPLDIISAGRAENGHVEIGLSAESAELLIGILVAAAVIK